MTMKLLIVVAETLRSDVPPPGVAPLIQAASEIKVLSPSVVGKLAWLTGDIDEGRRVANARLTEMLGRVADETPDVPVTDQMGDELVGTAVAEAFDDFDADHVLLVVAPGDAQWRRRRVVERFLDEYQVPVTLAVT